MHNQNVSWINERGTWLFYLCMLLLSRYSLFVLRVQNDVAWTIVIGAHSVVTFWLFHCKKGSLLTWEDDAGKYDRLTYWEQIDGGTHYSANRKFLMIVPLVLLFFAYEACSSRLFALNFAFTMLVLIPKLPLFTKKKKHVRGQSGSYSYLLSANSCHADEMEETSVPNGDRKKGK